MGREGEDQGDGDGVEGYILGGEEGYHCCLVDWTGSRKNRLGMGHRRVVGSTGGAIIGSFLNLEEELL